MVSALILISAWAVGALTLAYFAKEAVEVAFNTPTVYESHSTEQCVKVIYPDGRRGSCYDLPDRYNHVWVE